MDRFLIGHLTCRRIPESRALRKHVEHRITEWLDKRYTTGAPRRSEYHVVFDRIGAGHEIQCEIELTIASVIWRGCEIGPSPEESLAQAMLRLRPQTENFSGFLEPELVAV